MRKVMLMVIASVDACVYAKLEIWDLFYSLEMSSYDQLIPVNLSKEINGLYSGAKTCQSVRLVTRIIRCVTVIIDLINDILMLFFQNIYRTIQNILHHFTYL